MALERLQIYLKTKEQITAQKKRKLNAAQRKYVHILQQEEVGSDLYKIKETFYSFVKQRRKVIVEMDTRMFEEERKKAEEHVKVHTIYT